MASTYTLNNGIELIGTGEQSGTWGDTTNTNFELVDTALDGQVSVTLASAGSSGSPNNLPVSDGATSNGRNRMITFTDGTDLGATAFVQLTPNDSEKIIYVRNNLRGSRSIILFQGTYNASNDYEIPAGTTAIIYFDGAGSGAVAANVFNNAHFDALNVVGNATVGGNVTVTGTVDAGTVEFDNLSGTGAVSVTNILDEDNMASNSATALSTQQSIKAYVDAQVGSFDTLAEVLAQGNTTGGTDLAVSAGDDITFTNTSKAIFGTGGASSQLQIYSDGSNSYVDDAGAGTLYIRGSRVTFDKYTGETMVDMVPDGAVNLFYNNVNVFQTAASGINVTGAVTADSLTVNGSLGDFQVSTGGNQLSLTYNGNNYINTTGDGSALNFRMTSAYTQAMQINSNNDISFYEDTGTTPKMVWKASDERLGIGTAAPSAPLQVVSTAGSIPALGAASSHAAIGSSGFGTMIGTKSTGVGYIQQQRFDGTATAYDLLLQPNSGNVGIGTAAPASVLHVKASTPVFTLQATAVGNAATPFISAVDSNSDVKWRVGNLSTGTPDLFISSNGGGTRFTTGSGYTEAMRIDSSGKVGIGTVSPAYPLVVSNGGAGGIEFVPDAASGTSQILAYDRTASAYDTLRLNAASHEFNISGSNKMIINSSGNVGIGTTAPSAKLHVLGSGAVPLRWGDTSALGTLTYSGSDPIIQSNTGNMLFYSSGTETMRLTPANLTLPDLGATTTTIGVADAASNYYNVIGRGSLILKASSAVAGSNAQSGGRLVLEAGNSYNGQSGQVYIRAGKNLVDNAKAEIIFQQGLVESARFSPKRSLLLGTTVDNATFTVQGNASTSYTAYLVGSASGSGYNLLCRGYTTTGVAVRFLNSAGADVGSIDYSASATSYTSPSDYRLKTDVQPMTGASARVQSLNPVNFEWIADGTRVDGFLAHEAQAVVPEAVIGTKDAMMDEEYEVTAAIEATYDDDGNELTEAVDAVMGTRNVPDYQGIDQSKIVPLLTAALQEALNKIDDLETRLTALEG